MSNSFSNSILTLSMSEDRFQEKNQKSLIHFSPFIHSEWTIPPELWNKSPNFNSFKIIDPNLEIISNRDANILKDSSHDYLGNKSVHTNLNSIVDSNENFNKKVNSNLNDNSFSYYIMNLSNNNALYSSSVAMDRYYSKNNLDTHNMENEKYLEDGIQKSLKYQEFDQFRLEFNK